MPNVLCPIGNAERAVGMAARHLPNRVILVMASYARVDCPKSGLGPVQRYFARPGPRPLGPGHHVLALDLDLSGPGPEGLGQVQSRSGPGPHEKNQNIYIRYCRG